MEYTELIRTLGSLHSMLRDMESAGVCQGEHTIAFTGADGEQQTVHVYIDGTELQMCNTPGSSGFTFSTDVDQDN